MDYTWTIHGLYMDYTNTWTIHGLYIAFYLQTKRAVGYCQNLDIMQNLEHKMLTGQSLCFCFWPLEPLVKERV